MPKRKGILPPKFTAIPNEILDEMGDMSEAEYKVTTAICRKTFGWQKNHDRISLSQLVAMTGMGKPAVLRGLHAALDRGYIAREDHNQRGTMYYMVIREEDEVVSERDNSGIPTIPPVVSERYQGSLSTIPTKETTQRNIKETSSTNGHSPKRDDADAVEEGLILMGVRPDIAHDLSANPKITVPLINSWRSALKKPPETWKNPIGMAISALVQGCAPPLRALSKGNGIPTRSGDTINMATVEKPPAELLEELPF